MHSVVCSLLSTGDTEMNKVGLLLSVNSLSRRTGRKRNNDKTAHWVWW